MIYLSGVKIQNKMTWLGWVGIAALSLVLTFVLKILLWPTWTDIPREQFAHWINTLLRLYENSAAIGVIDKTSSILLFRFRRKSTNDDICNLNLEILNNKLAIPHRDKLLGKIRERGYKPILPDNPSDCDWIIMVNFKIKDIWRVSAGNNAARLAQDVLDVMGIDKGARFKLLPPNSSLKSRDRTLELRKRQKEGYDLA